MAEKSLRSSSSIAINNFCARLRVFISKGHYSGAVPMCMFACAPICLFGNFILTAGATEAAKFGACSLVHIMVEADLSASTAVTDAQTRLIASMHVLIR